MCESLRCAITKQAAVISFANTEKCARLTNVPLEWLPFKIEQKLNKRSFDDTVEWKKKRKNSTKERVISRG